MAKGYWIAHVDVNDPEGSRTTQLRWPATTLRSAQAMKHRVNASVGDVVIIEGYDGPQARD
jgi:hypothetical protein